MQRLQEMHKVSGTSKNRSAEWTPIKSPGKLRNSVDPIANSLIAVAAVAYDLSTFDQHPHTAETERRGQAGHHLLEQLRQVELPMWQDMQLGDHQPILTALRRMENGIAELLDADGWPMASAFSDFSLLAASWTRCLRLADHVGFSVAAETVSQLDWMVQQLLRSTRPDGSIVFAEPGGGINCNGFRKELLRVASDPGRKVLADHCLTSRASGSIPPIDAASEGSISEWAQVGVLRSGWFRYSPMLGLKFDGSRFELEIGQRDTLVAGECTPQIQMDGKTLVPDGEIGVACHLTSDTVDYVELQLDFEKARLHRQLLLLRNDALLLVADNLVSSHPASIEYRCCFPFGPGVQSIRETETTELYLRRGSRFCLVTPLFMPEWKSATTTARLVGESHRLTVTQSISGQGFWLPVAFDLNPGRSVKPRTWRQLTVSERRQSVGPDRAAAYRLQIGRKQWLFYRSIGDRGNRTFLGQNFADEFFVGSISIDGSVQSMLEVE